MKKLLSFCLVLLFSVGCVSITHETQDTKTTYHRFMEQKINGAEATLPDGTKVKFDSQESEVAVLVEALKILIPRLSIGAP